MTDDRQEQTQGTTTATGLRRWLRVLHELCASRPDPGSQRPGTMVPPYARLDLTRAEIRDRIRAAVEGSPVDG